MTIIALLLLFATLARYVSCNGYIYGCPTEIYGCSCEVDFDVTYRVVTTCEDFDSNDYYDFRLDLQSLENYEIDELVIKRWPLVALPETTFVKRNGSALALIHRITILDSPRLYYVGNPLLNGTFFDGLIESLDTIRIEESDDLDSTQWSRVSQSVGGADSRIKNLLLYNNQFAFRTFTFTGLQHLERVVLRKNSLTVIETDLSAFANLQFLDVSENRLISFIVYGIAPRLSTLYLNSNSITAINQSVFNTTITGARLVDLRGNPLSCWCSDIGYILNSTVLSAAIVGTCAVPNTLIGQPVTSVCAP